MNSEDTGSNGIESAGLDEMLPRVVYGRQELSVPVEVVAARFSWDLDCEEERPVCVICGEPALFDVSKMGRCSRSSLWVCESHIDIPSGVESEIVWRDLCLAVIEALVWPRRVLERLAGWLERLLAWVFGQEAIGHG